MNIKEKIHRLLFPKYFELLKREVEEKIYLTQEIQILESKIDNLSDLRKTFNSNRELFESFLVQDFIGFIPENINEPALKIFEDHAELFQRWVMWQSYYINRKSLHDNKNIEKYDGMMIYLKVLFLMAEANKKSKKPEKKTINSEPEQSFLDKALEGLNDFRKGHDDKI